MNKQNKQDATYWLHWTTGHRIGEPGHYQVYGDDGLVKEFLSYAGAIAWLVDSGESYFDNTQY